MNKKWVITGVAGFIGSNLLEALLASDQEVTGLDNFFAGKQENLDDVRSRVSSEQWSRFKMIKGDIRHPADCDVACRGADILLHQAAVGSVPRSVQDPRTTHEVNVNGTFNVFLAARDAGIKRIVYASSSSIYGDQSVLPQIEERTGNALSPYALSKQINESIAGTFARVYDMELIGLRYFNVFGPRQDPEGAYAAVIPRWVSKMISKVPCEIYGDGSNSRDFCFVSNVVQANLLAAKITSKDALNQAYNIGVNGCTSLNDLFEMIRTRLVSEFPHLRETRPEYLPARKGDILHSQASIKKAEKFLNYMPEFTIERGLDLSLDWYKKNS